MATFTYDTTRRVDAQEQQRSPYDYTPPAITPWPPFVYDTGIPGIKPVDPLGCHTKMTYDTAPRESDLEPLIVTLPTTRPEG
jgi:hypothetical protein